MAKYVFTSLIVALGMSPFFAHAYYCTEWTQTRSVTCLFAGKDARLFERQCENPCWSNGTGGGNWGPGCDKEQICFFENPNNFQSECSNWFKVSGVTCQNPNTGNWESKWERACKVGLRESWCSNNYP